MDTNLVEMTAKLLGYRVSSSRVVNNRFDKYMAYWIERPDGSRIDGTWGYEPIRLACVFVRDDMRERYGIEL